jgi:hypothetical protein
VAEGKKTETENAKENLRETVGGKPETTDTRRKLATGGREGEREWAGKGKDRSSSGTAGTG